MHCLAICARLRFLFQRVFYSREQHLTFTADLDEKILVLEHRHTNKTCVPAIPQQRISTVEPTTDEPCTFDDFGLVQGLEIDVRWM